MWDARAGVSITVGVLCVIGVVLMWTVGKKHTPRLAVALLITGVVGILATPIGRWLRQGVGWADSLIGSTIGRFTGAVVVGLVGLVALYVLAVHLYRKKVSTKTLVAAGVLPAAASSIPGVIGSIASWLIAAVATVVAWPITAGLGLG